MFLPILDEVLVNASTKRTTIFLSSTFLPVLFPRIVLGRKKIIIYASKIGRICPSLVDLGFQDEFHLLVCARDG